jgi:hypothetical protein
MIRPRELTVCFDALSVVPWEGQHNLAVQFHPLWRNQSRPILGKIPAEHASDVKQRAASTHQTPVVRAVTDNITFGAQDGILQRDRIENPSSFGDAFNT